ncbi:MAG TPA: hypothetical protein VMT66_16450 [Steroidobacteraceae bacterium]|nr:hypothetical protein [Steroidobacteraceae bacterium]
MSTRSAAEGATEAGPAAAMDRVLRAEHEARIAIAECERESAAAIEQARAQRRALIERTQARIVKLRARIAQALERRTAEILERHRRASTAELEQLADPARRDAALERLAARLTTSTDAQPGA